MNRMKELWLRKWERCAPRLTACILSVLALLGTLAAVAISTRFYTVSATDTDPVFVLAPAVHLSGEGYALGLSGITAAPDDELQHALLEDGTATLHVERSFALTLVDGGTPHDRRVVKGTVAEVLTQLEITLGEEDYTKPALNAPVTRETGSISVHRVTYKDYKVDEVVPFETEYQYTSLFYRKPGRQMVIQEGKNGYYKADLRDKLIDGAVVETTTLAVHEDSQPVPHILKVYKAGAAISKVAPPAGITVTNNVPSSYSTVYRMKATGYSAKRGRGSSGLGLYYGTFAVDPTVIPYGTKVYIASENGKFIYGWAIATDTGMFIHSNQMQVDLFYETYAESAINGVQQVLVYVP